MSDTGLDELDEDTGIFLGSPKPQEQYYQRRLTRSSKLRTPITLLLHYSKGIQADTFMLEVPMQVTALGEPPRMAALDLTNETG